MKQKIPSESSFTVWVVQRCFGVTVLGNIQSLTGHWTRSSATHSSWPCLISRVSFPPQQFYENTVGLCDMEAWMRTALSINWIKVNRFSSKQSNHSGFVNICNSRRSPHSLQSSTSCSLCGAWHNEDVALQTLLSIEGKPSVAFFFFFYVSKESCRQLLAFTNWTFLDFNKYSTVQDLNMY